MSIPRKRTKSVTRPGELPTNMDGLPIHDAEALQADEADAISPGTMAAVLVAVLLAGSFLLAGLAIWAVAR